MSVTLQRSEASRPSWAHQIDRDLRRWLFRFAHDTGGDPDAIWDAVADLDVNSYETLQDFVDHEIVPLVPGFEMWLLENGIAGRSYSRWLRAEMEHAEALGFVVRTRAPPAPIRTHFIRRGAHLPICRRTRSKSLDGYVISTDPSLATCPRCLRRIRHGGI